MSCLSSFFFFHKDIFMGFFLSWEDEYRDLFLSAKETMFFSCLLVGKVLPSHWQDFATALAKLCIGMAKVCKGKASGWQNFLLTDSELCGWQQSLSSASEYSPLSEAIQEGA